LEEKRRSDLGIAHPKSQNTDAGKNKSQEPKEPQKPSKSEKETRDEDQPSSGSGSGGESKQEKAHKDEKKRLKMDPSAEEVQPLSSKVYELINKGYIRETHPW